MGEPTLVGTGDGSTPSSQFGRYHTADVRGTLGLPSAACMMEVKMDVRAKSPEEYEGVQFKAGWVDT